MPKMWNESFLFTFGALFAIGMWTVITKRHTDVKNGEGRQVADNLKFLLIGVAGAILLTHFYYYWKHSGFLIPTLGAVLVLVIGAVVGSFSARFVTTLFNVRFGAKDPLIGVLVVLILVIVYSLPIYSQQISSLGRYIGLSSIKTPILELGFAEHREVQSAVISASKPTGGETSSAIPRPSDPRPGLDALIHGVSDEDIERDTLSRDDRYIVYFAGKFPEPKDTNEQWQMHNDMLQNTKLFLQPVKRLAGCLGAYVDIFPDSQLLLVDIKPVIQILFQFNADAYSALRSGEIYKDETQDYADKLAHAVLQVRGNILQALGLNAPSRPPSNLTMDEITRWVNELVGIRTVAVDDELIRQRLTDRLGVTPKRIDEFVNTCSEKNFTGAPVASATPVSRLTYLQPYVTTALANLLVAHGSPDEAVEVLTQWLDLWKCARGVANCPDGANVEKSRANAAMIPEWFGIRAEFYLNVLLYRLVGEANITYRDFLKEHVSHFSEYAAHAGSKTSGSSSPNISIDGELNHCTHPNKLAGLKDASPVTSHIRATILRSLLQNEHTFIQSERHFLTGLDWAEMENLYGRASTLANFTLQCANPEGDQEEIWAPSLAEYKITAGLLGLAIADRLGNSTDERKRSEEIRTKAKEQLRLGYRNLKEYRDRDRERYAVLPWSKRAYSVSNWEPSCTLAEQAFYRLNEPSS
jgi:hypothetical protein